MESLPAFLPTDSVVRLLQITDPHLFAAADGLLLGVNTCESFQAVLNAIQARAFDYQLVLATGDLVQDHNEAGYHRFAEMVRCLQKPVFWVEGNHDIQPKMGEILPCYPQIRADKQILVGKHWQIVLLDSQVFGSPHGALSPLQLDFLAKALRAVPDRFALIVLHHNLLPTNSAWLDQHSLRNLQELETVVKAFPQVKAFLHGHIHQAVDKMWLDYRVLATPSTCIQFKPDCHQFTLDLQAPGWREISLLPDGTLETSVQRLDEMFLPDTSLTGY